MPLSEFHQAARAKFDSNQSKMNNSSSDRPSSVEFVELLWENGQIVMQGQSNRPRKSSIPPLSSHPTKSQEKEGRDCVLPKISRFGAMDSVFNDFSTAGISGQIGPNVQDDDMVPWPNYPIDDYCLEFLSEFTGSNTNTLPVHTTSMAADKGSNSFSQLLRDSHSLDQNVSPKALNGSSDPGRIRNVQFNQMPQQWPSSVLNSKSRTLDFAAGNTTRPVAQNSTWDLPDAKLQMQEQVSPKPPPPPPSTGSPGLVNFSHFTRPVALLKANLQSADRLKSNGKASTTASTAPMESTLIESSCGFNSISQGQLAVVSGKGEINSTSQPQPELVSVNHSEAINCEDASRDKNIGTNKNRRSSEHVHSQGLAFTANLLGLKHDLDKKSEVVASSCVCSASGACTTSSDPKHGVKRKIQEGEESGYQSEDLEDESTGVKKTAAARGTTAKRSRAAAVHNLSERRRRDRINEKMRTLQELIPNCTKVDKASMLDEAIEYLKTLQLQLQVMSMSSGLCMPPMMLPPGMQHIRAPHMAHFPPMGVGMGMGMNMGMGMGFGMGMLDMNGSPMIPMPPMPRPQFPCSIPGNPGMPGIAGSGGLQMVGIPRQGHPVPMTSGSPFVPLPAHSTSANTMPEVLGMPAAPIKATGMAPFASSKDHQIQKSNSEAGHKVEPDDSHIPTSTQATNECLEESSNVQIKDHASHSSDGHINSISGRGNSSTGTSCFECAC